MIYFKKVYITDLSKPEVELFLRKASVRRDSSLDLASATTDIGTDKLFLGRIGKSALTFTRLRTSFEKFLPKLIIKFPLDTEECYYQLRFSLSSTVFFVFYAIAFLGTVTNFLLGDALMDGLLSILFTGSIYALLILLEIRLTSKRLNKALSQSLLVTPQQPA
ncbi:hypothetical protein [Mucilaginibacter sp.]|uniref:hypothetical protein n=1 Tax=Mucilaginibacter sp. TaxID=1882438 RepID=UPI0032646A0E